MASRRRSETVLAMLGPVPSAAQLRRSSRLPGRASRHDCRSIGPRPSAESLPAADGSAELAGRTRVDRASQRLCAGGLGWPVPVVVVAHSDVLSWWWRRWRGGAAEGADYRGGARGLRRRGPVVAPSAVIARSPRQYRRRCATPSSIANGIDRRRVRAAAEAPGDHGRRTDLGRGQELRAARRIAPQTRLADRDRRRDRQPAHGVARLRSPACLACSPPAEMRRQLATIPIFAAPARYEPFGLGDARGGRGRLRAGARRHSVVARELGRRGDIPAARRPRRMAPRCAA